MLIRPGLQGDRRAGIGMKRNNGLEKGFWSVIVWYLASGWYVLTRGPVLRMAPRMRGL